MTFVQHAGSAHGLNGVARVLGWASGNNQAVTAVVR
jgi:hypothetical protein